MRSSRTPVYAGGIEGGVEEAGRQLLRLTRFAPASRRTRGFTRSATARRGSWATPGRRARGEEQFGDQGRYLTDFYPGWRIPGRRLRNDCALPGPREGLGWRCRRGRSKTGVLTPSCGRSPGIANLPRSMTSTRPCEPAIAISSARANQLNYRQALSEGLPIGSGEIESAHRTVAQQRLKRPGAWWRVEHAESMLASRINRINGDWDAYWKALAQSNPTVANDNNRTNHCAASLDRITLDRAPRERRPCACRRRDAHAPRDSVDCHSPRPRGSARR
jgi:hypothetical protein